MMQANADTPWTCPLASCPRIAGIPQEHDWWREGADDGEGGLRIWSRRAGINVRLGAARGKGKRGGREVVAARRRKVRVCTGFAIERRDNREEGGMRWRHRRIRVARLFPKYFLRPLFLILTFCTSPWRWSVDGTCHSFTPLYSL
jgi:hypothetical protein